MPRRSDTPVDGTLAVRGQTSLHPSGEGVGELEQAFERWGQLRAEFAAERARLAADSRQLDDQGSLLLGAVRFAQPRGTSASEGGLTTGAPLAEAEATLARARAALRDRETQLSLSYTQRAKDARDEVLALVARYAEKAPPVVHLMVRNLGQDRRILHLRRPTADEAVLLLWAVSGRIPSRHSFLFDDSTDDPTLAPPVLYPEEGVPPAQLRLGAPRLASLLEGLREVWAVKGMLPMLEGGPFVRWLARGAVLEAELAEQEGFRNLLTREEAEQLTARLLTLKVQGKLGLELSLG